MGIEVATLSLTAESSGLKQGTNAMKDLERQAGKTEAAAKKVAGASVKAGDGAVKGGQGARVFAQQLSQVAQQGAVTGNYLGALAVQLPDIAGGLTQGAAGAGAMALKLGGVTLAMSTLLPALSIVAMIAIPALQNAFGGGKTAAEKLAEATDAAKEAMGRMDAAMKAAAVPLANLVEKYGLAAAAAKGFLNSIAQAEQMNAMDAVQGRIKAVAEAFGTLGELGNGIARIKPLYKGADDNLYFYLSETAEQMGLTERAAYSLQAALWKVENAKGLAAQQQAAAELYATLFSTFGTLEKMPPEMRQLVLETSDAALQALQLNPPFQSAFDTMRQVFGMEPGDGWLSTAIGRAKTLATELWGAAKAYSAATQLPVTGLPPGRAAYLAGQYSAYGAGSAAMRTATARVQSPTEILAGQYAQYGAGSSALRAATNPLTNAAPVSAVAKAGGAASTALSDAQKAAQQLADTLDQPVVSAVDNLSNAFGDFISGGLKDFKGFTKSILSSFMGMLGDMIAMAAKSKLLNLLGMGSKDPLSVGGSAVSAFGGLAKIFGGGGASGSGLIGGIGKLLGGGGAGAGGSGLGGLIGGLGKGLGALTGGGGGIMAALGPVGLAVGAGALLGGLFKRKKKNKAVAIDSSAQDTYYGGFYSSEERTAMQTASLQTELEKLGQTMPTSRAGFRAMVEGIDRSSLSGQNLYASLINMSGAMDQVLPQVDAMTGSLINDTGRKWRNFASGGDASGIYSVGEAGQELVATGRARVFNASQTRAILGGGSAAEAAQLRDENRQLMTMLNTTLRKQLDMFKKWDATGLATVTA